jgi:hypothetical protein
MRKRILLFLCTGPLFLSCEINPDKQIPSYIHIDRMSLKTDYPSQGTNRAEITDAWVYVDNEFMGAYELPVTLPVLLAGPHTVTLKPGIIANDNVLTRNPYVFLTEKSLSATLRPGQVLNIPDQEVSYIPSAKFAWKEDFEAGNSLDSTSKTLAGMTVTSDSSKVYEGSSSAVVYLDNSKNFFEYRTNNRFVLPQNVPVYLELNYSSDNDFYAGLFINYLSGASEGQQVIQLLKSTGGAWKKVYISLRGLISYQVNPKSFDVFFGGIKTSSAATGYIFLDNIKLIH